MKTEKEAERYLRNLEEFEEVEVLERLEGKHNYSFIFRSENYKYVLRANKDSQAGNLENERTVLELLEEKKIGFAPGSVHFDDGEHAHIVEFVGDIDIELGELEHSELERWVSKIADIHSLGFEEFQEFCWRNGYEAARVKAQSEVLSERQDTIQSVDAVPEAEDLIIWTEKEIEKLKSRFESESFENSGLTHGDLANSTRKGDNLHLIDWEFAKFVEAPEMSLAKLLINEVGKEKFSEITRIYREETEVEDLERKLELAERSERLKTIVWLLERSANIREESSDETERLIELAEEQKQKYTELEQQNGS
jgi:hypothetical protein